MTRALSATILGAALLVAGCGLTDLEPADPPRAFEGEFESLDPDRLIDGQVGMVSQFGGTELAFGISGLDPEQTYGWQLRRHECQAAGSLTENATYPPFDTDEFGDANGGTILDRMLGGSRYSVEVYQAGSADQPLACATLVEVNPENIGSGGG